MTDLYHNRVLELASDISNLGPLTSPQGSALKTARICGSTVRVDLNLSADGKTIAEIGVDPHACALGQAATAILSDQAVGASYEEILQARNALRDMLKSAGAPPSGRFWELRHLEAVRDYPPRHASTLLAFEAALSAFEMARQARSVEEKDLI